VRVLERWQIELGGRSYLVTICRLESRVEGRSVSASEQCLPRHRITLRDRRGRPMERDPNQRKKTRVHFHHLLLSVVSPFQNLEASTSPTDLCLLLHDSFEGTSTAAVQPARLNPQDVKTARLYFIASSHTEVGGAWRFLVLEVAAGGGFGIV
jgi:hypothetical protein